MKDDECGAGDGIHGLDAPVDDDGEATESGEVEVGFIGLGQEGASDEREAEQEEEERKAFFHTTTDLAVVRRFAMKARRLRPN